jgi:hypothetical protein
MPSTSNVEDDPSSQPKVHVITKRWEARISLMVIRVEVHDAQQLLWDFIGCFAFSLKELGQLKR